jgi:hypothetical protein
MTMKNFLRPASVLALLVVLTYGTPSFADEVTGTLSTGISGTVVSNSLTGTVTAPSTPNTAVIYSGGGGGGGGGSVTRTVTPVVTTTTPAPVSTGAVLGASVYNFTQEFGVGSTGPDVTALQSLLISDGYLTVAGPTGYFGSLTESALMKFQTAHGFSSTGYVGPLTLQALNLGTIPANPDTQTTLIANLRAELATLEAELAAIVASSTAT